MKDLDSFTVEQLNDFIKSDHAQCGDVAALARIALAAKRAEPVGYLEQNHLDYLRSGSDADIWPEGGAGDIPVYLAPQLNSLEMPDGWKLVPIEPTQSMVDAHISGMQLAGFSRAYRDMLAAAPEPQNQQQNIPEIIPQGWIKCSDQMPEDDEYYLTHSTAGVDVTIFHDGRFQDEYATHWMPLPAAPEKSL
ncbi:TPA: DUF551 domain-containing protein [Yersinia enterocolitica]|nr:DUF551 domain-containing protein [Yersinia enterocolitica]HDL8141695.1 DUF551 domain-containing protein [Yersinia enterocolitica]HDT6101146.1 DUF551 domain-containing protein [Yersinia enterocolitica]